LVRYTSSPLSDFFGYVSLPYHFGDFPRGVIDTKDVVYYFSLMLAFLFMATRALSARRLR
jgi:ABC-2 type transport system permease protein